MSEQPDTSKQDEVFRIESHCHPTVVIVLNQAHATKENVQAAISIAGGIYNGHGRHGVQMVRVVVED